MDNGYSLEKISAMGFAWSHSYDSTLLRTKHPGRINKYNQDRNGYNPAHQKAPCFKPA